jgi:hypothetical protein
MEADAELREGESGTQRKVTIGIPQEKLEGLIRLYQELSEALRKLISGLENKLDLNQRQVRAA